MSRFRQSVLSSKSIARNLALAAFALLVQGGAAASMTAPAVLCATPGCLDESFGTGGIAQVDLSPSSEFSLDIAVDPLGRIVSAGYGSLSLGYSTMLVTRVLANGGLDPSFGTGGVVRPQFTAAEDQEQATAIAIAPDLDANADDFDIVVAGHAVVSTKGKNVTFGCAIVRLNSDGTLEHDFGNAGKQLIAFATGQSARCNGIAIDHSNTSSFGRLVVAGQSDNVAALARLEAHGAIDTTFGLGGSGTVLTTETEGGGAYSVLIDANGRVLISTRTRVLRRLWNGAPDTSFGESESGRVDTGLANGGWGGLALDSIGRIIFVGQFTKTIQTSVKPARFTTTTDIGVVMLQANGQRDTTFDTDGLATLDLSVPESSLPDHATDVDVDAAGRIVVAATNGDRSRVIVVRLTPTGAPDHLFGNGGIASALVDPARALFESIVVTADGIVVSGHGGSAGAGAERTLIARYVQ